MNVKKYIYPVIFLTLVGSFLGTAIVLAEGGDNLGQGAEAQVVPAPVVGVVTAINGSNITVVSTKSLPKGQKSTTTYIVNATNATIIKNGVASTLSNIAVGDLVTVQGTVTGTNVVATTIRDIKIGGGANDQERIMPNIVGKVSAINGKILTVIIQNKNNPTSSTTFTVDATDAKILRGETQITLNDVAVGDTVVIQGAVTGTNVVATQIRDGKVGNGKNEQNNNNQALLKIQGNGQPVIAGTISAINGSTLTVVNSNVTYTVDATHATIYRGGNTIQLSGVNTGDLVIVQGTVSGTSVSASTVIDQSKPTSTATATNPGQSKKQMGFFGSIGQFFRHLFGF